MEINQHELCKLIQLIADLGEGFNRSLIKLSVVSFTKIVNSQLDKRPLKTDGHLDNCGLTSLKKEATGVYLIS